MNENTSAALNAIQSVLSACKSWQKVLDGKPTSEAIGGARATLNAAHDLLNAELLVVKTIQQREAAAPVLPPEMQPVAEKVATPVVEEPAQ